jgi:hypothetical protein
LTRRSSFLASEVGRGRDFAAVVNSASRRKKPENKFPHEYLTSCLVLVLECCDLANESK